MDTAFDFQVGVKSGVYGFAHLPGYGMGTQDSKAFELAEADVRDAARQGIFVNPTTAIAKNYAPEAATLERVQVVQRHNLHLLRKHGVRLTIGMDSYGTTAWPEAEYLEQLGVLPLPELLRTWWTITPQAIFPGRRIGHLFDSYEASFLVLKKNPLEQLSHLKTIALRVKQGNVLTLPN